MSDDIKITKIGCPSCGAPLRKENDHYVCDYCGNIFLISGDHFQKQPLSSAVRESPSVVYLNTPRSVPAEKKRREVPQRSIPRPQSGKKNSCLTCFVIAAIFFLFALIRSAFHNDNLPRISKEARLLTASVPATTLTPFFDEKNFTNYVFSHPSYNKPFFVGYEADYSKSLYVAVALNGRSDPSSAALEIYIKNRTGYPLDTKSKIHKLNVLSVTAVDNFNRTLNGKLEMSSFIDTVEENESKDLGSFILKDPLLPGMTSLHVTVSMEQWGDYAVDIPVRTYPDGLGIDYELTQKDDSFRLDLKFSSSVQQFISIYPKDILVKDDLGNEYHPSACEDSFSAGNLDIYYEFISSSSWSELSCSFDQKYPYEARKISVSFPLKGTVITGEAPVETTDVIKFSRDLSK